MRISYTPEQEELRRELRSYFAKLITPERREALSSTSGEVGEGNVYRETVAQMGKDGWLTLNWPREYGGQDRSPMDSLIFTDEAAIAGAPVPFLTINSVAPTIMAYGTEEQKKFYLPKIASGDLHFSIGYSEPGAGTDLANLRTTAVRDGDDYIVNGQKMWTSLIAYADYVWLAVRTNTEAKKHRGISMLIVPTTADGFSWTPVHTMSGVDTSATYYQDVRVPVANRVGEENDGWRVTMVTLSFERGTAFVGDLLEAIELLSATVTLARRTGAWSDPGVRRQAGHLKAELDALSALTKRNVSQAARTGIPGVGGTYFKLAYSETRHKLGEFSLSLLERAGLAAHDVEGIDGLGLLPAGTMVEDWLRGISLTIAAGTSQIQRNIVGERILGLPKEPQTTAPTGRKV
jgi:alkylation response protein AidB-like acyl-CoA dehydrogenase